MSHSTTTDHISSSRTHTLSSQSSYASFTTCRLIQSPSPTSEYLRPPHERDPEAFDYAPSAAVEKAYRVVSERQARDTSISTDGQTSPPGSSLADASAGQAGPKSFYHFSTPGGSRSFPSLAGTPLQAQSFDGSNGTSSTDWSGFSFGINERRSVDDGFTATESSSLSNRDVKDNMVSPSSIPQTLGDPDSDEKEYIGDCTDKRPVPDWYTPPPSSFISSITDKIRSIAQMPRPGRQQTSNDDAVIRRLRHRVSIGSHHRTKRTSEGMTAV